MKQLKINVKNLQNFLSIATSPELVSLVLNCIDNVLASLDDNRSVSATRINFLKDLKLLKEETVEDEMIKS